MDDDPEEIVDLARRVLIGPVDHATDDALVLADWLEEQGRTEDAIAVSMSRKLPQIIAIVPPWLSGSEQAHAAKNARAWQLRVLVPILKRIDETDAVHVYADGELVFKPDTARCTWHSEYKAEVVGDLYINYMRGLNRPAPMPVPSECAILSGFHSTTIAVDRWSINASVEFMHYVLMVTGSPPSLSRSPMFDDDGA